MTNILLMIVSSPLDVNAELRDLLSLLELFPTSLSRKRLPLVSRASVSSVSISRVGDTGGVDMKHEQVVGLIIPVVDDSNPANMTP